MLVTCASTVRSEMKSLVAMSRLVISCAMRRAISSSRFVSLISDLGLTAAATAGNGSRSSTAKATAVIGSHREAALVRQVIGPLPEAFESKSDRTLVLLPLGIRDLETGGLAHVLGRTEEHRGTLVDATLGCHPGEGLEQQLKSGPVVDDMLRRSAGSRLDLGELSVARSPMHLRRGAEHVPASPQLASRLAHPDTLLTEFDRPF